MKLPPELEALIAQSMTPREYVTRAAYEACVLQWKSDTNYCLGPLRAPLVVESPEQ